MFSPLQVRDVLGCLHVAQAQPLSDKQRTVEVASREDAPGIVLWVQAGSKTDNMENPEFPSHA